MIGRKGPAAQIQYQRSPISSKMDNLKKKENKTGNESRIGEEGEGATGFECKGRRRKRKETGFN